MTSSGPGPSARSRAGLLATAAALAWGLLPARFAPGGLSSVREALRRDHLNRADYDRVERGYYERLIADGRRPGAVADHAGPARAEAPPFDAGPLARVVPDLREYVLKPDLSVEHWGVRWSTNAQGMRDRPYARAKPAGTFRIALVGDSIGSGWGVDDGAGFEPTLERALDARSKRAGGPAVEILNCAVPGHAPGQRWEHARRVALGMDLDMAIYEATLADPGWDERRLRGLLARGVGFDSPLYRDVLARAGAVPGGDADTYKRKLRSYRWEVLGNVYRTIVADCRARGIPALWVLIPRVGKPGDPGDRERLVELARRSGFSSVIDLSDAYDGLEASSLAIAPRDFHPNREGHARLAVRIEEALAPLPEMRRLRSPAGAEAEPR